MSAIRYGLQHYVFRHRPYRLLFALVAVTLLFSMNFLLTRVFPGYIPMSLFLPAVVVVAWGTGFRGGLLMTGIGAVAELVVFADPWTYVYGGQLEFLRIAVYLGFGVLISFLFGEFRQTELSIADKEQGLSQSLTQLERQRQVAETSAEQKALFLAHMSHEIRTPLMAILGFTDLLKNPQLSAADRVRYLEIVERTGHHLKDVINDVLDISKVEAGRFQLEATEFSPVDLVEDIRATMAVKSEEKRLALRVGAVGPVPAWIRADSVRLRQILVNLVGNAIKFTRAGGVALRFWCEGDVLHFEVEDSGVGIRPEDMDGLFQSFRQVGRKSAGGTGLGLALSQRLAREMGGDLRLLRSKVGEGSVFELKVRFEAATPRPIAAAATGAVSRSFEGRRALVVDDSSDNRLLLEYLLGDLKFRVTTASNGAEALAATEREHFDLILLDMEMPVLDGYQTARELRARRFAAPVIALTAHVFQEDRAKCIEAGCRDYLRKPLEKDRLYEMLGKYC